MEDNLSKQVEEIEALCSIYDRDWVTVNEAGRSYSIQISESKHQVSLFVTFPLEYPLRCPPTYELFAPELDREVKCFIAAALETVYLENVGEAVIFQWIEKIREILQTLDLNADLESLKDTCREEGQLATNESSSLEKAVCGEASDRSMQLLSPDEHEFVITHGPVISDRKSTFQAHVINVTSPTQIKQIMSVLHENKKIANATHNVFAYRIQRSDVPDSFLQDCEDDGETQAGSRLLHLLQVVGVVDVLVVVSRWYGGIHLGPDRFRHINNAARQALDLAGLITNKKKAPH